MQWNKKNENKSVAPDTSRRGLSLRKQENQFFGPKNSNPTSCNETSWYFESLQEADTVKLTYTGRCVCMKQHTSVLWIAEWHYTSKGDRQHLEAFTLHPSPTLLLLLLFCCFEEQLSLFLFVTRNLEHDIIPQSTSESGEECAMMQRKESTHKNTKVKRESLSTRKKTRNKTRKNLHQSHSGYFISYYVFRRRKNPHSFTLFSWWYQ